MQINISNVMNISVMVPPTALASYAHNNLVCFTKDTPVTALGATYAAYSSAADVLAKWGSASATYKAAVDVFSQSPNILTGGGLFIVIPMLTGSFAAETLAEAIVRAQTIVYFGGFSYAYTLGTGEAAAAATAAQTARKLFFLTSSTVADIEASGLFDAVFDANQTYTRCLYHSTADELDSFRWAYAGRGMSTNFSGSNTTSTMNLKQLTGVLADETIDQTTLGKAKVVGADIYVNIAGRPSLLSYGANGFFDDMYNLSWFVGALEVAGFNYLATVSTKIPQTEAGVDGLKGALRNVCSTAVKNAFIAPGEWTSPDTFGDPVDFKRNIKDIGYYLYSAPVALQSSADRTARECPVVSVAIKYAGAIHTVDCLIYVNQ